VAKTTIHVNGEDVEVVIVNDGFAADDGENIYQEQQGQWVRVQKGRNSCGLIRKKGRYPFPPEVKKLYVKIGGIKI